MWALIGIWAPCREVAGCQGRACVRNLATERCFSGSLCLGMTLVS